MRQALKNAWGSVHLTTTSEALQFRGLVHNESLSAQRTVHLLYQLR